MSEVSAPAPVASSPSAPSSSSSSTPSSGSQSSIPSSSGQRLTSTEMAAKLIGQGTETEAEPQSPSLDQPGADSGTEAPWYETYQDIHGTPVQEFLEAVMNGQLPESLWDKFMFDLKDGDTEWKGNINDLRNGAMMRQNHTRKSQELANEKRQFYAERDEMIDYFNGWKSDPQQMIFGLHRMGAPVLDAFNLLGTQLTKAEAMNKINPGSGDEWLEAVFQKAELADLKRRTEKQQQATQQQEAAQREQQLSTQMRSASAEIFKEIGLEVEESSWELYKQHVQLVYDNKQAGPNGKKGLTRQDLQKAAQATKSQLEQYARNYANRQTKQPPGAKLSGTPLDAGAPKSVPARAPQKSEKKTTQQIQDELAQRAGFRQR